MDKYSTLENLSNHKDEAYGDFENIIRSAPKTKPIIFEESGISDHAINLIHSLIKDYNVFVVEVCASLDTSIDRVRLRGTKNNFFKDDEFVMSSKKRYLDIAQKKYEFGLVIENNDLDEKQILAEFYSAGIFQSGEMVV